MNKEEWEDYLKLASEITEKLDNTATYESWLIIQEYVDRCQERNQKHKEAIDKLKEDLNLIIEYGDGEDAPTYDKQYGEFAKNHLKYMNELLKEVE